MKKILSIVAISTCALLLSGCGKDKDNSKVTSNVNSDSNTTIPTSNETSNVSSNSNTTIPTSNETSNVSSNTTTGTSNTTSSNNKNLKCSADYSKQTGMSAYGVKTIASVDANFKGDKIQDMKMTFTFTLPNNLKDKASDLISSLDSTYKQQYSGEHFTVSTNKISDTKLSVSVDMDYKNMTDAEKKQAGMGAGSESYSVNKAELERQGFTCK